MGRVGVAELSLDAKLTRDLKNVIKYRIKSESDLSASFSHLILSHPPL